MNRSPERLYASSISIVSGAYSVLVSGSTVMSEPTMTSPSLGVLERLGPGGALMLAVGVAVLVHGVVLLTPVVARMRTASGPLMILWAVVMIGNQALLAVVPGWGMSGAGSGMSGVMAAAAGWDLGMVALAVLMLSSGLIMLGRPADARASRERVC